MTRVTRDLSQCDVCVPSLEGRKYQWDFDCILCLYTPSSLGAQQIYFTSVDLSSVKFQQNLGLSQEICALPKLSAIVSGHAVTDIVKRY